MHDSHSRRWVPATGERASVARDGRTYLYCKEVNVRTGHYTGADCWIEQGTDIPIFVDPNICGVCYGMIGSTCTEDCR